MSGKWPHQSHPGQYGPVHQQQYSPSYCQPQPWDSGVFPQQPNIYSHPQQMQQGSPLQSGFHPIPCLEIDNDYPAPDPSYAQPDSHGQSFPYLARAYLETCYNCGSLDHWAQDCPEPRRYVPHGQGREVQEFQTQAIRPRNTTCKPPIITRYPVSSHGQQGFTGYPVAVGYPTYPLLYGPTPPPSADCPHGPPHWQRWSIPSPHHLNQRAGSPATHGQACGPTYYQCSPTPPSSLESFHSSRQGSVLPVGIPNSIQRKDSARGRRQSSTDYSVPITILKVEDEPEDLNLLHIPDLPTLVPEKFGNQRTRLVQVPLPAISESDKIGAIHPYPPGDSGNVQSALAGAKFPECANIKDTEDFKFHTDDPVFKTIRDSATLGGTGLAHEKIDGSQRLSSTLALQKADLNRSATLKRKRVSDGESTKPRTKVSRASSRREKGEVTTTHGPFSPDDKNSKLLPMSRKPRPVYDATHAPPPPPGPPPDMHYSHQSGRIVGDWHPGFSNNSRPSSASSRHQTDDRRGENSAKRRRQDDDIVPRHKRNQPKVAEAYGRRW